MQKTKNMPYTENLAKATELKKELDKYRPLSPEAEKRIMQKLRLDWNYHSSHIEGNLLTYGETKALILFGHTAQAKPLKDHIEMTGHDEAIKYIEEVIKQERPLTENFIRELHKLILKDPYEVDAITPDGKPTKRMISVGSYKTVPNHVKTKTGEIFYFASPEETPAKMADLMHWYNETKDKQDTIPVLFATEFHYRFIRIHPFDDGNGRIARLVMNFILMHFGYPPAIIKTEDKNSYFAALQQADAGQLEYFFNYMCQQVIRSLDLMIRGAKGESIEEPDDLDREIELLKRTPITNKKANTKKTREILQKVYKESLEILFVKFFEEMKKFDELFLENFASCSLQNEIEMYERYKKTAPLDYFEYQFFFDHKNPEKYGYIPNMIYHGNIPSEPFNYPNIYRLVLDKSFRGYINAGIEAFNASGEIVIEFHDFNYEIKGEEINNPILRKLYDEKLSDEEIKKVIDVKKRKVINQIRQQMDNIHKK